MSIELGVDDDILVKTYNEAHLEEPLQHCVNAVINAAPEVEPNDDGSKSEIEDPIAVNDTNFVVGSYVRCTYDDGIDYEAKIIHLNDDKGTCRIKYVGYDNEQTVTLDALVASWGEEARRTQCEAAMAGKATAAETAGKGKKPKTTSRIFNPPPMPPIPPMPFDSDDDEKNQEFAQLLISWFMTGYYTGLHQRNVQEKKLQK